MKVRTYLFEYWYGDSKYVVDMPAYTEQEARERIKCVSSAKYLGERMGVIPAAVPGAGLLVRLICTVRNFFAAER